MTNAQKWVAAFLGLFIILFVLSRVFDSDESKVPEGMKNFAQQSETQEASADVDGLTLIRRNGCTSCHGENLEGRPNLGPNLYNAKTHWTRDELINYLRNPSSYSGDPRFEQYKKEFGNIMMPSFDNVDIKDLGKIADYILSMKK